MPSAARPRRATSGAPRRAGSRGCRSVGTCTATSSGSSARRWTRPASRRSTSRRCSPASPTRTSNRWTEYGDNLFRLNDRHGDDFLLAPTHEEMFTLHGQGPLRLVQGPAAVDLPDPDQVPRRGPPARRPAARPRVRDEGLVLASTSTMRGSSRSYQRHRDAYIKLFDRLRAAVRHRVGDVGCDGRLDVRGVPRPDGRRRGHATCAARPATTPPTSKRYVLPLAAAIPFDGLPAARSTTPRTRRRSRPSSTSSTQDASSAPDPDGTGRLPTR